jgi:hypothetical protein
MERGDAGDMGSMGKGDSLRELHSDRGDRLSSADDSHT